VRLGNPRLEEVAGKGAKPNREAADRFAANVLAMITTGRVRLGRTGVWCVTAA
jgi:hypothetical protein